MKPFRGRYGRYVLFMFGGGGLSRYLHQGAFFPVVEYRVCLPDATSLLLQPLRLDSEHLPYNIPGRCIQAFGEVVVLYLIMGSSGADSVKKTGRKWGKVGKGRKSRKQGKTGENRGKLGIRGKQGKSGEIGGKGGERGKQKKWKYIN